ncbi:hypothetical protein [Streptomyces sp. NPDC002533]
MSGTTPLPHTPAAAAHNTPCRRSGDSLTGGLRVFLAAPFVQFIDPADGVVQPHWRQRLSALRGALLDAGHAVFNAHHNEGWGEWGLPPQECVPSDFRAMQCADLVLAYPGTPPSTGVALELGWASALRKPVALLLDPNTTYSPMISALGEISPVLQLPFDGSWSVQCLDRVVRTALDWATGLGVRPGPWSAPELDPALAYHRHATDRPDTPAVKPAAAETVVPA